MVGWADGERGLSGRPEGLDNPPEGSGGGGVSDIFANDASKDLEYPCPPRGALKGDPGKRPRGVSRLSKVGVAI